jgi:hypothetical protein
VPLLIQRERATCGANGMVEHRLDTMIVWRERFANGFELFGLIEVSF